MIFLKIRLVLADIFLPIKAIRVSIAIYISKCKQLLCKYQEHCLYCKIAKQKKKPWKEGFTTVFLWTFGLLVLGRRAECPPHEMLARNCFCLSWRINISTIRRTLCTICSDIHSRCVLPRDVISICFACCVR